MNKNTYLFSEIIIGLRDEYLKNQKLLNELDKYIKISDDKMCKYIFCKTSPYSHSNEIFMFILKEQNKLEKILNYIGYRFLSAPCHYTSPLYLLKKENDMYNFKFVNNTLPKNNKYNIEVINKKEVSEIADEINNSLLMQTKCIFEPISKFQSLSITLRGIDLIGNFEDLNIDSSYIHYNSNKDTIAVCPGVKPGIFLIDKYLKTRIPKEIIPEEYRKIIDDNLEKHYNFNFDVFDIGCPLNKKTELSINEVNNKIVLQKKKTLKFYE